MPLRLLDPRVRLLAAIGAALCFALMQTLAAALAGLGVGILLVSLAWPAPGLSAKRLLMANGFIAFLWLTVPPTVPGDTVFSLGPLDFSREGLDLSLLVSVKCNAVLLSCAALLSGISPGLMGCALERLRAPRKLVFLFLFTCRYIHVIGDELQRLRTAAALRGFRPRTSLHTYRTLGNMFGLVFVNSFDRSHRVYEAMRLRGFRGVFHTVTPMDIRRRDRVFVSLFLLTLAGVVLLDCAIRLDLLSSLR
jgi:cobalt/nickel transport system permease protein